MLRALDAHMFALSTPQVEPRAFGGSLQHDSMKLLKCLRCVMNLRSRSGLKETLIRCLDAALPPALSRSCLALVNQTTLPSESTISRSQALFDAALVMLFRDIAPLENSFVWVWADSSPQASFDIFQTEFMVLSQSEAVSAFSRSVELANLVYHPPPDDSDSNGEGSPGVRVRVVEPDRSLNSHCRLDDGENVEGLDGETTRNLKRF